MLSCKGLSVRRESGQNFRDMGTAVTKAGWTDQAAQLDFCLACECPSLEPRVELRGSAWLSALQTSVTCRGGQPCVFWVLISGTAWIRKVEFVVWK